MQHPGDASLEELRVPSFDLSCAGLSLRIEDDYGYDFDLEEEMRLQAACGSHSSLAEAVHGCLDTDAAVHLGIRPMEEILDAVHESEDY